MRSRLKRIGLGWLLSAALSLACFGPVSNPAEAGMINLEQEIEMGQKTAAALEAQYGLYQDDYQQERIEKIGQRLAAVCGRDELKYSFKILNNDEVNALACPGGYIYVYKGLMDYMPTDAELAGVLGHEVGHVAKKHTVHAMEKQMLTSILGMAAMIASGGANGAALITTLEQALFAGYSRTDERGADKEGFNNTLKAGFNPYSMLVTVSKLEDLAEAGGGSNYGLFSSHPEPEERIKRVKEQLAKLDIHPEVISLADNQATVVDGSWRFSINQGIGGSKALYRAYMVAGALWSARQRGPLKSNYFVVYDQGDTADIYYDDIQVFTVYSQDAYSAGYKTSGAYAAVCAQKFREWIPYGNQREVIPKNNI